MRPGAAAPPEASLAAQVATADRCSVQALRACYGLVSDLLLSSGAAKPLQQLPALLGVPAAQRTGRQGRIAEDGKVRPLDVKKGDRVLFGKYAGTEIKIDGEEFLMMREEDILGVLAN